MFEKSILIINCSPERNGVSAELSDKLISFFPKNSKAVQLFYDYPFRITAGEILSYDVITIITPLFFNSFPSRTMDLLKEIELQRKNSRDKKIKIYAISNGGLSECTDNHVIFDLLKIWCEKCGFDYFGGLGIGSGFRTHENTSAIDTARLAGVLISFAKKILTYDRFIFWKRKTDDLNNMLIQFSDCISTGRLFGDRYIRPLFPHTVVMSNTILNIVSLICLLAHQKNKRQKNIR